jgi:GNAT superfamily N-acetyltransferase
MSAEDVTAIETITRNCFRSFANFPNAELIDDGKIFGVMSHLAIPFFSGIATTQLEVDEVEPVIDRFREKNCPFRWWLTPSTRPRELESTLEANGMRHAYDAPGMLADLTTVPLDTPVPHGITIRRLKHVDELTDWLDVFTVVFSSPEHEQHVWRDAYVRCGVAEHAPWQHFVAFDGDVPVATTSVLIEGDLAGVYFVATLEQARGRGIGAAVTRAGMRYARNIGATRAALQSSELGFGVYRSLGFVKHCDLRLYQWRPEP